MATLIIDRNDSINYRQMLKTLDAQNGKISGSMDVTYDEIDNNLAKIANGKRRVIDYVLVRNGQLIKKIERKVQTFLAKINGNESHLSDHYGMEFNVSFIEDSFVQSTAQRTSN